MFGSSEDRARLFAGRKRRQRISSAGSGSSSGSTAELALVSDEHIRHESACPSVNTPVSRRKQLVDISETSVLSSVSPLPAESRIFQLDQQRLQSEHLSQVLYNSPTLPNLADSSHDDLRSTTHVHSEGLDTLSKTCSNLRTITTPGHITHLPNSPLLDLFELLATPAAPRSPLSTIASELYSRPQSVVSLRGGFGGEDLYDSEAEYALRKHVLRVQNPQDFGTYVSSWYQEVSGYHDMRLADQSKLLHPCKWMEPVNAGLSYQAFLDSLTITKMDHFGKLFGPAPGSNFPGAPRARAAYLHSLGGKLRLKFLEALRGSLLLKLTGFKCVRADGTNPSAMLSLLLSTTEEYYGGGGAPQPSSAAKSALNALFDKYREADAQDKDIVGAEGTMKFFEDIGVNAEDLDALATFEIIQAPTMGEMGREGFVKGWSERNCDTVEKQKAYIQSLKDELPKNKGLFTRVYKYTFPLARAPGQKAVALDNAVVFWELLFASQLSAVKWSTDKTPWLSWWNEFVNSEWKKSVNKDMWNETLKFAQLTLEDESMGFWNEESSWPSVIDEFVEWVKKEKRGDTKEEVMDEEY